MPLTSWIVIGGGFLAMLGGLAALARGRRAVGVAGLAGGFGLLVAGGFLVESHRRASVIRVVGGHYGRNCAAPEGNATRFLAESCEGQEGTCTYRPHHGLIGDPCSGTRKNFVAYWRCGESTDLHEYFVPPEASGRVVELTCPGGSGAVVGVQPVVLPPLKALSDPAYRGVVAEELAPGDG